MKFGHLAFEGFENELLSEIKFRIGNKKKVVQKNRLFLIDEELNLVWSQLNLNSLETIEIDSINDAVKKLKLRSKLWASYSSEFHRRTELIQTKIFSGKRKKETFLQKIPKSNFGFWCLLDEKKILLSQSTSNPFPLGQVQFEEDKVNPPSRAYLKLWEAFTLHTKPPQKGQIVLDMGSCPGGWTWVLQNLGCEVLSIDKAPIDDRLLQHSNVKFLKKDAFKLKPTEIPKPAWFFSDIICEPQALLDMVKIWINYYPDLKFLCTIKYKGETDFKITDEFLKIPFSRIVHLCYNKHEVTWLKV
jgi:23S rRNA (cytidine2498-2'-O)-methyltransferase